MITFDASVVEYYETAVRLVKQSGSLDELLEAVPSVKEGLITVKKRAEERGIECTAWDDVC